jgi:hypothetical protein
VCYDVALVIYGLVNKFVLVGLLLG